MKYSQNSNSKDIFYQKEEKNKMENIHNKFIQEKNKGVTVKELCLHFNISKSTAYNWIKLYSPIKRPVRETITAHKIYQLEREIQSLRTENEIFKRSGCGLNSTLDEKIAAIERLKNDFSIYALCKTLNILKSTYYHRVLRSPEKTQYEIAVTALKIIIIALLIMRYCFQIKHNTEGAITGMKSRILKTILAI